MQRYKPQPRHTPPFVATDSAHTYDVLIRTTHNAQGRRHAAKIARRFKLDVTTTARLASGTPVLIAQRMPHEAALLLQTELKALQINVFLRGREPALTEATPAAEKTRTLAASKKQTRHDKPTRSAPATPPSTHHKPTTRKPSRARATSATRRSRPLWLIAFQNNFAVMAAYLTHAALTTAASGALIWHVATHRRWLLADLPWPFAASYVLGTIALVAVLLLVIKTLLAPSAKLPAVRFDHASATPLATVPLRQLAASIRNSAPESSIALHLQGELAPRPHHAFPISATFQLGSTASVRDAAFAVAQCCRHHAPSLAAKWVIDADYAMFRLWYNSHVADAWDLAIDTRIFNSRNLATVGWIIVRAFLTTGRLPALLAYWTARAFITRGAMWRSCRVTTAPAVASING